MEEQDKRARNFPHFFCSGDNQPLAFEVYEELISKTIYDNSSIRYTN